MSGPLDDAVDLSGLEQRLACIETIVTEIRAMLLDTRVTQLPDPAYLAIKQAASLTSLSAPHIRRAIRKGELPASNCGTISHPLWRIARADLVASLQKKKGGT